MVEKSVLGGIWYWIVSSLELSYLIMFLAWTSQMGSLSCLQVQRFGGNQSRYGHYIGKLQTD